MGDFIDSLVRVFEILAQGALAVAVVGYLLIWVHPIKRAVTDHLRSAHTFVLSGWAEPLAKTAAAVVVIAGVYFLGVITNVVGYWLLDPAHEAIIANTASIIAQPDTTAPMSSWEVLYLPFSRNAKSEHKAQYLHYLSEEASWRNTNLEGMKHALDPLLKQIRILRGTVVCALLFAILAGVRVLYFLIALVVLPLLPTTVQSGLVSTTVTADPSSASRARSLRICIARVALAHTVYFVGALVVYASVMPAYRTIETEYHLLAHYGAVEGERSFRQAHPHPKPDL